MKSTTVDLSHHRYSIIWESNFASLEKIIQKHTREGKHFVITNKTVHSLYKGMIQQLFDTNKILIIDDGEDFKNFHTITNLAEQLLQSGANRKSILWAFGGGVIGDITGFLASIYMRGIPYFQIPTTLLSMVDSSVGGKTGVNLKSGKNMIGTFYQPDGVFIHVPLLKTLNEREFHCGLSEVIKSALLCDPDLFLLITNSKREINVQNENLMEELSYRSVLVKTSIVTQDEKETGLRAILNLGHTLAHALESYYNYTGVKHGEAVSIGITFASFLSLKKGMLKNEDFFKIKNLLMDLNMLFNWKHLPQDPPDVEILLKLMKGDKKNIDESIRFILLNGIGIYNMPEPIDIPTIRKTLEEFVCL